MATSLSNVERSHFLGFEVMKITAQTKTSVFEVKDRRAVLLSEFADYVGLSCVAVVVGYAH